MEIRMAKNGNVLAGCSKVENSLVKTALASVPQALPQLVLAQQVAGTHLMEVVIRGDLVRAAGGGGWRAFSMGPNGIEQQARLFDLAGLQAPGRSQGPDRQAQGKVVDVHEAMAVAGPT
jgi:hypothetical protein